MLIIDRQWPPMLVPLNLLTHTTPHLNGDADDTPSFSKDINLIQSLVSKKPNIRISKPNKEPMNILNWD